MMTGYEKTEETTRSSSRAGLEVPEHFDILIVEDNPGDAHLTTEALREVGVHSTIKVVLSGEECLELVDRIRGHFAPKMVLLDLNMPGKDGRLVLAEIRSQKDFESTPIIVLTGSRSEEDVLRCSDLNANSFVIKPQEWNQYVETASFLKRFLKEELSLPPVWISTTRLESLDDEESKDFLRILGETEQAITIAEAHLDRATAFLKMEDRQDWAKLVLLSLNLRTAWEAISIHWKKMRSSGSLYETLIADAPWLAVRVQSLQKKLQEVQRKTKQIAEQLVNIWRASHSSLDNISGQTSHVLDEVRRIISQEANLMYASMTEPPAAD
jgi:two-component system, chemotaxis family, response regulator Rcp1